MIPWLLPNATTADRLAAYLDYCMSDIGWDYSQLTDTEKRILSEDDFNLIRQECAKTLARFDRELSHAQDPD